VAPRQQKLFLGATLFLIYMTADFAPSILPAWGVFVVWGQTR